MVDKIIYEHLTIDKLTQEVSLNNIPLQLSTTEFEALLIFAENGGEVLDRDFLVENLRGILWQSYDRSIDVLVSRLRTKLNKLDPNTEYIKTIHGIGYKFIDRIKQ
jgi:DNA-binding response OmpR family regulator